MDFINCTPHDIVLNNGNVFEPCGVVTRIKSTFTEFDDDGVCQQEYGDVEELFPPQDGVKYIVSSIVLDQVKNRTDLVAPTTGHRKTIRTQLGKIKSVPGFRDA